MNEHERLTAQLNRGIITQSEYDIAVSSLGVVIDITTEDKVVLHQGDRAYNYYDMKPGVIGEISKYPQPNTMMGQNSSTPIEEWNNYWFDFNHDDGSSTTLDGSRICSIAFATKRGWIK